MDPGGVETWLMHLLRNINRGRYKFHSCRFGSHPGLYATEVEALGGAHGMNGNIVEVVGLRGKVTIKKCAGDSATAHACRISSFAVEDRLVPCVQFRPVGFILAPDWIRQS